MLASEVNRKSWKWQLISTASNVKIDFPIPKPTLYDLPCYIHVHLPQGSFRYMMKCLYSCNIDWVTTVIAGMAIRNLSLNCGKPHLKLCTETCAPRILELLKLTEDGVTGLSSMTIKAMVKRAPSAYSTLKSMEITWSTSAHSPSFNNLLTYLDITCDISTKSQHNWIYSLGVPLSKVDSNWGAAKSSASNLTPEPP